MFDTRKFGTFVACKRKNANMTQQNLAEKLNITRQAISRYEQGNSFPDISILIKIAETFAITIDELIGSGLDGELLWKIVPLLDTSSKEAILQKIIEGESDWKLLKVLLPHIEDMTMQLEAAVIDGALPQGALDIMQNYFIEERTL